MTELLFNPVTLHGLTTMTLQTSPAPSRVISGDPEAHESILHEDGRTEIGVWEISPGSFHSSKIGVSEFMYFVSGAGTITRENGEVIEIRPDAFVSLPDGSHVVWNVEETARKVYVITQAAA
ncbi:MULTISPECIES: cupin domain-containing protein [unclassified Leucobacter]|uniref:cupin domain-containing protein n=1 Tax=unclassified Leucobacter TaxID=2621730 RepID=UPI00190415B8|nr:cupin domain-containing protein [Leucobacter sp. L43]